MTTIEPDHAEQLHEDGGAGATAGPWTWAGTQHVRQSRWHDIYWLVVRNEAGEHWGLSYRVGLTENQEHELPWEGADGPLTLTRLHAHEVVRVEYRTTPPAEGGEPS
ncbi:hypothetical protein ACH4T9_19875 [Micromonospora sp. NPDC020750]|uniref:hypothetical protein n=1 Tax=unclassified Micromonospora TaxID=2617518 RepID=UPI0037961E32